MFHRYGDVRRGAHFAGRYAGRYRPRIGDDLAVEHQLYYPQTDKPRAILTTCATGLGAAANLSALLKASIPEALGIDIVACDVETLADPRDGSRC